MTNASLLRRAHNGVVSDEDPAPKPARRRFSAAYKLSILEEYEQLSDPGTKGALLRREGLYSSHIVEWRRAREAGALAGLAPRAPRSGKSAEQAEIERLRGERAAGVPAPQAPPGTGDAGKSIGALVAAAGRGRPGDDAAAREAARVSRDCLSLSSRCSARRRPVPPPGSRGPPITGGRTPAGARPARPARRRRTSSAPRRPGRSSACCARSASPVTRRPRSTSPSWTRAPTWPPSRPSTACCGRTGRCASGGARPPTQPGPGPSCWPPPPTSAGHGTSPS